MKQKLKRIIESLHGEREGITGLETAIILIAFVVVASVFAYTVLSAGIFSSQKAQEAIHSGMESARCAIELKGSVVALGNTTSGEVTSLVFTVANALSGVAVDFTPPNDVDGNGIADAGSTNVTVMEYHSQNEATRDLVFSTVLKGKGDSDYLLETGEKFEVTVDLTGIGEAIDSYHIIVLEVKPPMGAVLIIERTMPPVIDDVMIVY
jgi:flagellin FlaB